MNDNYLEEDNRKIMKYLSQAFSVTNQIKDDIKDIKQHIEVLNGETGQLEICQTEIKKDIGFIKEKLEDMKQSHYLLVGASVTALLTAVADLLMRFIFK